MQGLQLLTSQATESAEATQSAVTFGTYDELATSGNDHATTEDHASLNPLGSQASYFDPFFSSLPAFVVKVADEMGLDQVKWSGHLSRLASSASYGELLAFNALLTMKATEEMIKSKINDAVKSWVLTDGLKKVAINQARVFLLSPRASAYRPKNAADAVYNGMLRMNIPDLPPASNTSGQAKVKEIITRKLSDQRYRIKDVTTLSLQPGSSLRNIACLTSALTDNVNGVEPSLALCVRVAFIRWHVCQYAQALEKKALADAEKVRLAAAEPQDAGGSDATPSTMANAPMKTDSSTNLGKRQKAANDAFWKTVDYTLQTMMHQYETAEDMDVAFTTIYEEDKAEFGKPEEVSVAIQAPRDCPPHVNIMFDAARDVTNVQSLDEDPLEGFLKDDAPAAKRKCTGY
ncbi:hypothetical protein EV714DRAFT_275232 [Schizophyllum commune]